MVSQLPEGSRGCIFLREGEGVRERPSGNSSANTHTMFRGNVAIY